MDNHIGRCEPINMRWIESRVTAPAKCRTALGNLESAARDEVFGESRFHLQSSNGNRNARHENVQRKIVGEILGSVLIHRGCKSFPQPTGDGFDRMDARQASDTTQLRNPSLPSNCFQSVDMITVQVGDENVSNSHRINEYSAGTRRLAHRTQDGIWAINQYESTLGNNCSARTKSAIRYRAASAKDDRSNRHSPVE